MVGGAFCPLEGKANPLLATPAFARAAQRPRGAAAAAGDGAARARAERDGFLRRDARRPDRGRPRRRLRRGRGRARVAAMVGLDLPVEGHPIQVTVDRGRGAARPAPALLRRRAADPEADPAGSLLIGGGWPARRDPATGRPMADPRSLAGNLRVAHPGRAGPGRRAAAAHLARHRQRHRGLEADHRRGAGRARLLPSHMFPWMGFTAGPIAAKAHRPARPRPRAGHDIAPSPRFGTSIRRNRLFPASTTPGGGIAAEVAPPR